MDINQLTLDSIQRYYKVLEHTGYMKDSQVYKLLMLSFIAELFHEDFSWYITEKDYALLTNIVNCLSKNSCIIPYTGTAIHIDPIKNYLEDMPVRVADDAVSTIRLAPEDVLRLVNK